MGKFSIDEKNTLSFPVKITDSSIKNVSFSLAQNPPAGAKISSNTGVFTWTPTDSQGGKSYTFDVAAKKDSMTDRQSITITVNDVKSEPVKEPEPTEPEPITEPKDLGLASFVDETKDPQSYVDRYNTEESYKKWFDDNYSEYSSIYQAVGLEEPVETPAFVDPNQDPQYYVDRYNTEESYKKWFDDNYPNITIYQAVGLEEPKEVEDPEPQIGLCGAGTELVDGKCELVKQPGGGCLIATATYGSEMAPQVQYLREIRDGKVMSTESGISFMTGFNSLYYSFSPYIADYERENPVFKEMVKVGITPLLSSLSVMSLADSEEEILGYGIGVILMNLGMYVAAPTMMFYGINKMRKKVRF
ncbi:MAG: Ig domain-containing protein [Nitrosopumilus sp.]|nr:Ig domain-containing protein [Nitrosopumilus sp.]MDH3735799.1 Ig domain-containing protein [Nitrosopumilus sp.]MDH3833587.1 Ig domain-containing protein [Nitrosopumilus sp.]